VRAKTGLLTRVTSLSGYAERPDGERLCFAVIANGFRRSAQEAMDALDAFAAVLVAP
jgi:D-alanyl-D-alanine carboxypeptidase/D-alanyl-D-alanine-endopeptidase (penicillin-binding protein 4)